MPDWFEIKKPGNHIKIQYDRDTFGGYLQHLLEIGGWSRNEFSHQVGIDPSYVTRLCYGTREPPRKHIVDAMTRVLTCSDYEKNKLMVMAGYAPQFMQWGTAIQAVTAILSNSSIPESQRDAFSNTVELIAQNWAQPAMLQSVQEDDNDC